MTEPTFKSLHLSYEEMPGTIYNNPLKYEIFHLMGSGEDNANDTLADGETHEGDWDDLALRSVSIALCDSDTSDAARTWFAAQGLKF